MRTECKFVSSSQLGDLKKSFWWKKKSFLFIYLFFLLLWSLLVRRYLSDHLLWSIFQSSVTHITHYKSCWTLCVGSYPCTAITILLLTANIKACIINPTARCSAIQIATKSFLFWRIDTPYLMGFNPQKQSVSCVWTLPSTLPPSHHHLGV